MIRLVMNKKLQIQATCYRATNQIKDVTNTSWKMQCFKIFIYTIKMLW